MPYPPCFLHAIEQTAFSTWLRDSPSLFAFWLVISFHAIGMGVLAGASAIIGLRTLGVAHELPPGPLVRLYPFIWAGFWIQIVSGVFLLIAYPTKSLMNLDFYVKLAAIAVAMIATVRLRPTLLDATMNGRTLAVISLAAWLIAITAGRLLAYTATYLTYPVGHPC